MWRHLTFHLKTFSQNTINGTNAKFFIQYYIYFIYKFALYGTYPVTQYFKRVKNTRNSREYTIVSHLADLSNLKWKSTRVK